MATHHSPILRLLPPPQPHTAQVWPQVVSAEMGLGWSPVSICGRVFVVESAISNQWGVLALKNQRSAPVEGFQHHVPKPSDFHSLCFPQAKRKQTPKLGLRVLPCGELGKTKWFFFIFYFLFLHLIEKKLLSAYIAKSFFSWQEDVSIS